MERSGIILTEYYLQRKKISYIFAGSEQSDIRSALDQTQIVGKVAASRKVRLHHKNRLVHHILSIVSHIRVILATNIDA